MNPIPTSAATRATILMYHRVGEAENHSEKRYNVTPERFADHMLTLQSRRMCPCTIDDFVAWIEGEAALPEHSFLLTFDDGFLDVYEHAFPFLSKMGWPATVFLVSGMIGKTDTWTQHENPSPMPHPLLGRAEILEMARGGFSFHSHTRSHCDLRQLPPVSLMEELRGARQDLEDLLGSPVPYLAYPYGLYDETVIDAAKASGYSAAFSVLPGFNRRHIDRYRIRRIDVYGTDSATALLRKVTFGSNDGSWRSPIRYYAGRVGAGLRASAKA